MPLDTTMPFPPTCARADTCRFQIEGQDDDDFTAAVARLTRDLRNASAELSEREARYLVAAYYNLQELRIRSAAQERKLEDQALPHLVISWLNHQCRILETQIRAALAKFAGNHRYAQWPLTVVGIGPVIAAGLVAYFDPIPPPAVGHWWSFAGLNPNMKWQPGQRRPYSAQLKVLTWKISGSFVKFSGHERGFYGKLYRGEKEVLIARNERGDFTKNAKKALKEKRWRDDTKAIGFYKAGRLPPGHIDAMARRWVAKMFISHYWTQCYRIHFKEEPPKPYVITHLGHGHMIDPPEWPPIEDE
jgi:hypothetical protein